MLAVAPLVWGEIAVTDMERAVAFYQQHFNLSFHREVMDMMEMAIIETEVLDGANVALCKHPLMIPSLEGATVYLHVTDKLNPLLETMSRAGVQILLPLTPIKGGEKGYISLFVDSEGNKVGLWAKQQ
ncbi:MULTISPECIES: VOC family protein [unclassified Agarivorans]|uniref:VOC family protein n=1 Tax=unclassified Agarivorans TaxID=2636026 RepID=UPI003D7CACCC